MTEQVTSTTPADRLEGRQPAVRCPFCGSSAAVLERVEAIELALFPEDAERRYLACTDCGRHWYIVVEA